MKDEKDQESHDARMDTTGNSGDSRTASEDTVLSASVSPDQVSAIKSFDYSKARHHSEHEFDDLRARLRVMPEAEKEHFIATLAEKTGLSLDEQRASIAKVEAGEMVAEINHLYDEMERLSGEIAVLQRLLSIHVPTGRPWMMALEMQFAAMRLLDLCTRLPTMEDVAKGLALSQLAILRRAEAYAWSSDTATAAWLASQTIPPDSIIDAQALPGATGWWWFEQPLSIIVASSESRLAAMLWTTTDAGLSLSAYALAEHGPMLALQWAWPYGVTWADFAEQIKEQQFLLLKKTDLPAADGYAAIAAVSRLFLAGCAWLQQRVVISSPGHVERHRRKQLARERDDMPVVADIKVIQLRRSESHAHVTGAADGEPMEWSCRWLVSGHWRNQPYRSSGERKLIYIMPFVKGPSDKPLKTAAHTVYQVSR